MSDIREAGLLKVRGAMLDWQWQKTNVTYQIADGWLMVRDKQDRDVFTCDMRHVLYVEASWPNEEA